MDIDTVDDAAASEAVGTNKVKAEPNADSDEDESDESEDDEELDVNLEAAPASVELATPQFKSRYGYTPSANKYVRPGLEQTPTSATTTPVGGAAGGDGDEEEEDEELEDSYATFTTTATEGDAWQSPTVGSGPGTSAWPSSSTAGANESQGADYNGGGVGGKESGAEEQAVQDPAAAKAFALKTLSDVAPREGGVRCLPATADPAVLSVVDVRELPPESLVSVRLPGGGGAGRVVRTSFDLNLDGLEAKPWRSLPSAAAATTAPSSSSSSSSSLRGVALRRRFCFARAQCAASAAEEGGRGLGLAAAHRCGGV